jgi:uncharacterized protein YndB with AHSA1/START domain
MEKQGARGATANALNREMAASAEISTRAPAAAVYDVLADIASHLRWGGEMQREKNHLLSVHAPEGPATVGTEFTSTGIAPEGRYADRSVVTEARPPSAFEFVTEGHVVTKRGKTADVTNVTRYEITPTSEGSRVSGSVRTVRASALPGPLALLNVGLLVPLVRKESEAMVRRGLQNLAAVAEERADQR